MEFKTRVKIMLFSLILALGVNASALEPSVLDQIDYSQAEFREKLNLMLLRSEESVKLTREQIASSQSAPFLPELYLQLGELLSQKSNILYYIQTEKLKDNDALLRPEKAYNPVVAASQEAIAVYDFLLRSFENFFKRPRALLLLSATHKSIDQIPGFIKAAKKLIAEYSATDEALKASLMLAQHFFDRSEFKEARKFCESLALSKDPSIRGQANYRLGLIEMAEDKFSSALKRFETVALDPELKPETESSQINLRRQSRTWDWKREALIDSLPAYTRVHEDGGRAVDYYSKLAPSEVHFQEVMERLAGRYLDVRKYEDAVKLMRAYSLRISDAQRIVQIYHEVLPRVPPQHRGEIAVEEMRHLLKHFGIWSAFYQVPEKFKQGVGDFFQRQIRELATRAQTNRDWAKAGDFTRLFLESFPQGQNRVEMAQNLATIYEAQNRWSDAGETYLRLSEGKFGPVIRIEKFIRHSLERLERAKKQGSSDYYEELRNRGLFMAAAELAIQKVPSLGGDPATKFAVLKTQYEQGFFPEILDKLLIFSKEHSRSSQALQASELILDYFTSRNDFEGLDQWVAKLAGLRIPSDKFAGRLREIGEKSRMRVIQDRAKSIAGYNEFTATRSLVAAAHSFESKEMKNLALKQALYQARQERDPDTYFEVAASIAKEEGDSAKREELFLSVAREKMKLGRFVAALADYESLNSREGWEESVRLIQVLRRWDLLKKYSDLAPEIYKVQVDNIHLQALDFLRSGFIPPAEWLSRIWVPSLDSKILSELHKSKEGLDEATRVKLSETLRNRCANLEVLQDYCEEVARERIEKSFSIAMNEIGKMPQTVDALQESAIQFQLGINALAEWNGHNSPLVRVLNKRRSAELFLEFAKYLDAVGAVVDAELKPIVLEKVKETTRSARTLIAQCEKIGFREVCRSGGSPVAKSKVFRDPPSLENIEDFSDPESLILQKKIFADPQDIQARGKLLERFYQSGAWSYVAAFSSISMSVVKGETGIFQAYLGCALWKKGFRFEAQHHWNNARDKSVRARCIEKPS